MAQARVLCRVSDVPEKRIFVQHMNIGTERKIVYPSVWFNANGEAKPEILVMPNHNIPRAHIHATIREGFRTNTLDHRVAVRFLFDEFGRNQGTLNEDWRSFNRVIGLQGNHITLAHIVNVVPNEAAVPMLVGADDMTDQEVLKYVIAKCAIYRPGQITRDDYRNLVVENVNALLEPLGEPVLDIAVAVVNFKKCIAYQPYVKMTAAIDMMLNEFPHHVFAQARIGTIVTRFKDCEALISTQTITKCLGLDFPDFAEWIWTQRCADQFMRVIRAGEEMDNPRSYAMYFVDLGLSPKSPYSASVNPDLHFFYHVIGVCSGLQRSRNARFVGQPKVNNLLIYAMVMHHVMGS